MNRVSRVVIVILLILGGITSVLINSPPSALTMPTPVLESSGRGENVAQTNNFRRHFQELGVEGSILIYDLNNQRVYQHNRQRNSTAFLPASTFKILNSLISIETKVIADEIAVLTWDGIQRQLSAWNRDLNMRADIHLNCISCCVFKTDNLISRFGDWGLGTGD